MVIFFWKKTHRELEKINEVLKLNASNNYRDATIDNMNDLEKRYNELLSKKKLNSKQTAYYRNLLDKYHEEFKNFTHKAQKAGW